MSNKWRSSTKVSVDGDAFKRARLAFKNQEIELARGEYGHGSQGWLSKQARVSPRTINALETGEATLKTVDAVSNVLAIKGREFIQGYGADFTKLRATGVVDFRPKVNGRLPGYEAAYLDLAFLVTIDPLVITVDDDLIDEAKLTRINLTLAVGDMNIDFDWLYNVSLTSRSTTWLGDEEDVSQVNIYSGKSYQQPIMFKQSSIKKIGWKDFISHIRSTDDSRILIEIRARFEHFEKTDHVLISVEEIKGLFNHTYPLGHPYWVQPKALMA